MSDAPETPPQRPEHTLEREPVIVPAETINPKHVDQDASRVIRKLRRDGYEAYLVGGCVRDLLLDKAPKDFDVITSATPAEVHRAFSNSRIIGRRFPIVHVMYSSKIIEVSTFRNESTPGFLPSKKRERDGEDEDGDEEELSQPRKRKSRREMLADLEIDPNLYGTPSKDAHRRDFSINALLFDPDSSLIIDYVGGLEDIEKRVVRAIREPNYAMKEDPVRVLRAMRFAAKLNFTIEPATLEAIQRHAKDLALCSQRRIFEEIVKILGGGYGAATMRLLSEHEVLSHLLPEVSSWIGDSIAEPEVPVFPVVEEEPEEEDPEDAPMVFAPLEEEPEPAIALEVNADWEPSDFMVDAMVQVSWMRRPLEGSNEWHCDPDDEVMDDVFEAAAFQRDLEGGRSLTGLEAERARARAALKVLERNGLVESRIEPFVIDNLEAGRTRQLIEQLPPRDEVVPVVSRRDLLLRYLDGLDALQGMFGEPSHALLLAALFGPQLDGVKSSKVAARIDEILDPIVERNCVSRRDRDMTRRLLGLHANPKGGLMRQKRSRKRRRQRPTMNKRSQFSDALLLKWLECRATGKGWMELLEWEEGVYAPNTGSRPATHKVSLTLEDDWG